MSAEQDDKWSWRRVAEAVLLLRSLGQLNATRFPDGLSVHFICMDPKAPEQGRDWRCGDCLHCRCHKFMEAYEK